MRRALLVLCCALLIPIVPFVVIGELPGERWLLADTTSSLRFGLTGAALLALDLLLPMPSSVIGALLGGRLGLPLGFGFTWLGLCVGQAIGYALGRLLPARFASALPVAPSAALVFLTRPVPVFAEAVSLAAGTVRMPPRIYAASLLIGNALYAIALAASGAALLPAGLLSGPGLLLPMLLPVASYFAYRRWERRRASVSHLDPLASPAASSSFDDASTSRSVSALSWLLLAYVLAMAMIADLAPFELRMPDDLQLSFYVELQDVLLNLLLLFPAGFLFRLAQRGRGEPGCLDALLWALLLSTLLEGLQLFIPGRTSSPIDVVNNAAGAWAGARLHSRLGPWFDRKLSQQLSLELSLSNVLYLLLPLISLEALADRAELQPLLVAPLIGLCSLVAAALYHHRLQRASGLSALRFSWAIAAYFGIGLMPALMRWPVAGVLELVAVVCGVRLAIALLAREPDSERRFQSVTVSRALPFLVAYILLHGAYPFSDFGSRMPALGPAIEPVEGQLPQSVVVSLIATIAAFTLLGYLLAERRARSDASSLAVIGVSTLYGFGVCAMYVALRGTHAQLHASVATLFLLALSCAAGASIQRAQLSVVMTLLARGQMAPSRARSA